MNFTSPRGDQNAQIALIGYKPSESDEEKGTVFMDTAGWFLDKLLAEANLPLPFMTTLQPLNSQTFPDDICLTGLIQLLDQRKYPIILTCDSRREKGEKQISDVLKLLVPSTKGELSKYAGSLLTSPQILWPHYIIPIISPQCIFESYSEKDITVSIDLGRAKEELDFFKTNGKLNPLPERELIIEPPYPLLMDYLCHLHGSEYIANDIETIRPPKEKDGKPNKASQFYNEGKGHPGYPYTCSLAESSKRGVSFSFWDYSIEQCISIWRELDWLMRNISQIGQNFFLFDLVFYEALGFRPNIKRCIDTLIRHHILWPELPHSLQFQTRQYTRQPYYKDEGKQWNPKQKKSLMHYNALDTTVDYEVFEAQEVEFAERPHLR